MKRGDLLRLTVLDQGYATEVGKDHGYLWIFIRVEHGPLSADDIMWRVRSIATGYEAMFYHWRLERVEDVGEG